MHVEQPQEEDFHFLQHHQPQTTWSPSSPSSSSLATYAVAAPLVEAEAEIDTVGTTPPSLKHHPYPALHKLPLLPWDIFKFLTQCNLGPQPIALQPLRSPSRWCRRWMWWQYAICSPPCESEKERRRTRKREKKNKRSKSWFWDRNLRRLWMDMYWLLRGVCVWRDLGACRQG